MKGFGKIVIYILLMIGAVVMLLPFAWMITTSFKLPSEVSKWPPQWGSKNFLSKREIKVKGDFEAGGAGMVAGSLREALASVAVKEEENVFTLAVDDDLFYRGELHVLILSKADYAPHAPLGDFKGVIKELSSISKDLAPFGMRNIDFEGVESAEEFFQRYFTAAVKDFDRLSFVPKVSAVLQKYADLIEKSGRGLVLMLRRVKSDREDLESFLKELKARLVEASLTIKKFSKGSSRSLTASEIKELQNIIDSAIPRSFPETSDPFGSRILRTVDLKILKPIRALSERLSVHLDVWKTYRGIQTERLDGKEIVARFVPEEEKFEEFLGRAKSSELLKGYHEIIEEISKEGAEGFTERFSRELDERLAKYLKSKGVKNAQQRVTQLRDVVSSMITVLNERNLNLESLISKSDDYVSLREKLISAVPDSLLLKTQLSRLQKLIPQGVRAGEFLMRVSREIEALSYLRKLYADAMSKLEILEAPSAVKAVRVKYDKEKYWEVIEIVLDDVPPVYLRDEDYKAAVFFNFKEVLANIFQNYVDAWHAAPFGRYYLNTVFVATTTTILEVIVASMAAFAFSVLNFKGRDFLFALFLATMMVPGEVLLVPNYITISKFGWIDTYYALIVPWIVSVFAIFLIRQHFMTLPRELYDAAKIDGCSSWRYLWTIAVPLSKPVIITGALLKFVGSWNAFLWVLIVTNDPKYRTLPVGLYTFRGEAGDIYNQLMAAATFSVLPVIILFLFAQKYFIRGIARTGLK